MFSFILLLLILDVFIFHVYSLHSLQGYLKFHNIGFHKFKSLSSMHAWTTSTNNNEISNNDIIFNKNHGEKNNISLGRSIYNRIIYGGCTLSPAHAAGFLNINIPAVFRSQNKLIPPPTKDINTITEANTKGKILSIIQKIFFGINAKGRLNNCKAGDTRTEISMLINGLSMCSIIGIWAFFVYIIQKREEYIELNNMRKEIKKEHQYREDMYIDAINEILRKLSLPKLKTSLRTNLQKQLKELDPDHKIRDYLSGKTAERPYISVQGKRSKLAQQQQLAYGRGVQGNSRHEANRTEESTDETDAANESPASSGGGSDRDGADMSVFDQEASMDVNSDAARIIQLLVDLNVVLKESSQMNSAQRETLLKFLQARFEQTYSDPTRRTQAMRNVQARLTDIPYWENLVQSLP